MVHFLLIFIRFDQIRAIYMQILIFPVIENAYSVYNVDNLR